MTTPAAQDRLRILMACAAFPPFADGGGPVSALLVARLLQASGHEVEVVNVSGEDKRDTVEGVPVRRLPSLNIDWNYRLPRPAWKKLIWHALENFNPRAFFVMRREMRRFAPDLVLTDSIENVNVATWAAAKSLGLPVTHILRSAFLLCWKASMRKGDENCAGQCASCAASSYGKRLSSHFVDAVIGETQFILGRHLDAGYFPSASAHVVPGAIDVSAAAPRSAPFGRPVRFGFIGVHAAIKGLDTLAAAARRLEGNANVAFVIAGAGFDRYAEQIKHAFPASTTFTGWVKPEVFLPEIDVLVVPSLFQEPFGRVVIEAFSHGAPVISARSGGLSETIEPGFNGVITPPGDAEALADAIAALAADPDEIARLSKGAVASLDRYRPERIAAAFDAAFHAARQRRAPLDRTFPRQEARI